MLSISLDRICGLLTVSTSVEKISQVILKGRINCNSPDSTDVAVLTSNLRNTALPSPAFLEARKVLMGNIFFCPEFNSSYLVVHVEERQASMNLLKILVWVIADDDSILDFEPSILETFNVLFHFSFISCFICSDTICAIVCFKHNYQVDEDVREAHCIAYPLACFDTSTQTIRYAFLYVHKCNIVDYINL